MYSISVLSGESKSHSARQTSSKVSCIQKAEHSDDLIAVLRSTDSRFLLLLFLLFIPLSLSPRCTKTRIHSPGQHEASVEHEVRERELEAGPTFLVCVIRSEAGHIVSLGYHRVTGEDGAKPGPPVLVVPSAPNVRTRKSHCTGCKQRNAGASFPVIVSSPHSLQS